MSNCSDVLIIGGGVIGCATAYYLAQKGVSVTVLEKAQIGEGVPAETAVAFVSRVAIPGNCRWP
jgi:Glycine/D-amino acid oxidases (deaminating)